MKEFVYTNRLHYNKDELLEGKISDNPFEQFHWWFEEAVEAKTGEPYACTLATSDKEGNVKARIVLMRGYDENGFMFFTNYNSAKGKQIAENGKAALHFFWPTLERQVSIEGKIIKASAEESDAYFISRPREHQLGAWVSNQSEVIESRKVLEDKYAALEKTYENKPVPRPPHWGGYIVVPTYFEFWQGRISRLHDRICYKLKDNAWISARLSP